MTTIQTILLLTLLIIWLCFSVVFLITAVQSFIYDRKREKREREQAVRDAEYHENRWKLTAISPSPKPACTVMWSLPILKSCSLPTAWTAVPYSR